MPDIAVPAGLVGTLAIVAFGLAILAMVLAPVVARSRRYTGPTAALALVPFALLTVAAILAASVRGPGHGAAISGSASGRSRPAPSR